MLVNYKKYLTKEICQHIMVIYQQKGGGYMKDNLDRIQKTVRILMQLDEKSLLLIDSGAKLLAARQKMDKPREEDLQKIQKI
jgi:hypothetical protein